MELHAPDLPPAQPQALDRAVVERAVRDLETVSAPIARPSNWWPRQMPYSGRPWSTIARTSATCESIEPGSPGPFASSTPSGASAST